MSNLTGTEIQDTYGGVLNIGNAPPPPPGLPTAEPPLVVGDIPDMKQPAVPPAGEVP